MNWQAKVPPFDSQYSFSPYTDAQDCLCEALAHTFFSLTGIRVSPRFWAYTSNTTINGNTTANVMATVNQVGFVLYEDWPTPANFSWAEYYTPTPKEIWDKANKDWKFTLIPPNINQTPLFTLLDFTTTNHAVEQLTVGAHPDHYFDSEPGGAIKTLLQPIVSQHSLSVKNTKEMKLTTSPDGKTYYLEGDLGKLGFADIASLQKIQTLSSEAPGITNPTVPQKGIFESGIVIHN